MIDSTLPADFSHAQEPGPCEIIGCATGQEMAREIDRLNAMLEQVSGVADIATASLARLIDLMNENERLRAELDAVAAALPPSRYLDPPDGGSVLLSEQVSRMRAEVGRERPVCTLMAASSAR